MLLTNEFIWNTFELVSETLDINLKVRVSPGDAAALKDLARLKRQKTAQVARTAIGEFLDRHAPKKRNRKAVVVPLPPQDDQPQAA